jgi:hypothetical protein
MLKIINLLSKGTRVRWSAELFWLIKVVPTSKKFEERCSKQCEIGSMLYGLPVANQCVFLGILTNNFQLSFGVLHFSRFLSSILQICWDYKFFRCFQECIFMLSQADLKSTNGNYWCWTVIFSLKFVLLHVYDHYLIFHS